METCAQSSDGHNHILRHECVCSHMLSCELSDRCELECEYIHIQFGEIQTDSVKFTVNLVIIMDIYL